MTRRCHEILTLLIPMHALRMYLVIYRRAEVFENFLFYVTIHGDRLSSTGINWVREIEISTLVLFSAELSIDHTIVALLNATFATHT